MTGIKLTYGKIVLSSFTFMMSYEDETDRAYFGI